MKVSEYNLGKWIKDKYDFEWKDDMNNGGFLDSIGYDKSISFTLGREYYTPFLRVFTPKSEENESWFCEINMMDESAFDFIIPDGMSKLIFFKEYKHLFDTKTHMFVEGENNRIYNKKYLKEIIVDINYVERHASCINAYDNKGEFIRLCTSGNPDYCRQFLENNFL